jgi:hypothetical protein
METKIISVQQAIADQWTGERCYLDGAPAKIVGRLLPFAHVVTDDGKRSVEWAWHTVNRIMRRDRYFVS